MSFRNYFKNILSTILKKYLSAECLQPTFIGSPKNILIIRQHNQFGDMLASVSLFRAVKETFPDSEITLLAGPENYYAVCKNEFIDELFIFEKKRLINPNYYIQLKNILNRNYDLVIVPVTVAISSTSCILAGLAKSKIKIGPNSLNGQINKEAYVFTNVVDMNWKKCPDAHVSDFILDIIRPFGIKTKNYKSSISFDENDITAAKKFISSFKTEDENKLVGFHIGAGKPQNKWPLEKYIELINTLKTLYKLDIYFTGSAADAEEINYMKTHLNTKAGYFIDRTVPQLAALVSLSDLFITNDTGVMHVAGATNVSQVSLFGPTNPFNWAPVGYQKFFLRKSELINDISVNDVTDLVSYIFTNRKA
jgi:ADP-heptose:LPS heptosyltransferase